MNKWTSATEVTIDTYLYVPQKPFTKLISTDDDLRNMKWFKRKTLNLTKAQASPNSSLQLTTY